METDSLLPGSAVMGRPKTDNIPSCHKSGYCLQPVLNPQKWWAPRISPGAPGLATRSKDAIHATRDTKPPIPPWEAASYRFLAALLQESLIELAGLRTPHRLVEVRLGLPGRGSASAAMVFDVASSYEESEALVTGSFYIATSSGLQPTSHGLQPISDGLQALLASS